MDKKRIEDMAFQLLNISFDTDEWDEGFLNNAIREVTEQLESLKRIKEARPIYDVTMDLWDLLTEAYDRDLLMNIG